MYKLKKSAIKLCDSCEAKGGYACIYGGLETMGRDCEFDEIEDSKCDICARKANNFVTYIKKTEAPPHFCWECGKRLKNAFKIEDTYYCGECMCDVVNDRITEDNKSTDPEDKVDELQDALARVLTSISDFAEGLKDDWGHLKGNR